MTWVLLAVVCLAAGGVGGWFAGRSRQSAELAAATARLEAAAENEHRLESTLRAVAYEATDHSREAVGQVLAPIADTLARYETRLGDVERARLDAYAQLRVQLSGVADISEGLREQTGRLLGALRSPQVRGQWGEVQLRRIVEAAGMVEHCDFTEQHTGSVDGRAVRPDLIVRLSGGRTLVVDAKAPLQAYLQALEIEDETGRDELLRTHAKHLRRHAEALAGKEYWRAFDDTPEMVVLFVPADAFLDAALRGDPALLEDSFARGVVIASPATLMALLRTVAHTWRQEALARHAKEVHRLGRELHERLGSVAGHFARLGSSLEAAVGSYNAAVASVESRLLVTARRFSELEVAGDPPESPAPVVTPARRPTWDAEAAVADTDRP
ncbi:DNA recombination protein RmuC [Glycomyces albidus]|jgi:DNA recombination protein RmuC|uniref:DNA recombination protein RmuC n=1 Tax=Glycomyces albidus TaxID=2656774 RepID=A0A6L5GBG9_9ACTN|nr:DNA recombination protein RmuC [Glycomyces albidus]MQM26930.1 DNA recombination protein RmuC [Glycomyces albidus]